MQTFWPPSTIFDPTPAPRTWLPANVPGAGANTGSAGDAMVPPWYSPSAAQGTPPFAGSATMQSLVGGIMTLLQSLMGMLGAMLSGGPQQQIVDATLSSTGDPHLAETGTTAAGAVDDHFDSMVAHDDLLHSSDVAGGYRVSTRVTTPNANGITYNASATVHTAFGQDAVTMRKDGTFSVTDHGQAVSVGSGQTVTLSGGESVTCDTDGSLVVSAGSANGGTISTTLRGNGTEVDVTTQAHQIGVGGDIVRGIAAPARRGAIV